VRPKRIGRDGLGARFEIRPVHVQQHIGRVDDRPSRPQRKSDVNTAPIEFGSGCAVEQAYIMQVWEHGRLAW